MAEGERHGPAQEEHAQAGTAPRQPSPPREPVHITTVEDIQAWGEQMRAEISTWAQQLDPSPSPPEPAEADPDPPATARSPGEAAQLGPQAVPDDADEPVMPIGRRGRRLPGRIALLGAAAALALGVFFAAFHFLAGWPPAASVAPSARAHSLTHHPGHREQPAPAPGTTSGGAAAVRTLTPASAAAFGVSGAGQGDNGDLAHLAIDANSATAWHTDWYTSAHFGNLYPGTGLLVDMGRPVTVTAAAITLGRGHGGSFQVRIGAAPALASLRPVAHAVGAAGVIHLHFARPAHGRYVLLWFTRLPPTQAGTFQASVHEIELTGRA
jgi:hypothetical protein